jgi:hypothetical protein
MSDRPDLYLPWRYDSTYGTIFDARGKRIIYLQHDLDEEPNATDARGEAIVSAVNGGLSTALQAFVDCYSQRSVRGWDVPGLERARQRAIGLLEG